jgi:hypothetical protein
MLITAPRNCWQDVAPRVFDAVLASDAANWPDTTTPRTAHPIRIGKLATCGIVITYRR